MIGAEISGELKKGYTVFNKARDHHWFSDEPKELEGLDLGPRPSELLLSSLISCKLITLKMYANRKNWNIDGVKILLTIIDKEEKIIIKKKILFNDQLSEKQKKRLTDISGRCPIAKLLSNSIEFKLS